MKGVNILNQKLKGFAPKFHQILFPSFYSPLKFQKPPSENFPCNSLLLSRSLPLTISLFRTYTPTRNLYVVQLARDRLRTINTLSISLSLSSMHLCTTAQPPTCIIQLARRQQHATPASRTYCLWRNYVFFTSAQFFYCRKLNPNVESLLC